MYSHNPKDRCGKETQKHIHKSILTAVTRKSFHSEVLLFMIVYQTKHFLWNVPKLHKYFAFSFWSLVAWWGECNLFLKNDSTLPNTRLCGWNLILEQDLASPLNHTFIPSQVLTLGTWLSLKQHHIMTSSSAEVF